MSRLFYLERPATAGPAAGLVVICHGRGTDERDVIGLARVLDPDGRLIVCSPRAPLRLPGWSGYHWYQSDETGEPDPETLAASAEQLAELHDELWERTGLTPQQTILAGFSMGAVMSYALTFAPERPEVCGVLALSGRMAAHAPAELFARSGTSVLISHGMHDETIPVQHARAAHERLETAGLMPVLHEFDGAHHVDAASLVAASIWLRELLP